MKCLLFICLLVCQFKKVKDMVENVDCGTEGYSEKDGETFICRKCSSICSWAFQDPNCKKRCPFFNPLLVPEADTSTNSDIVGQNTSYDGVEQTTGYADVEKMKDMVENLDCGTEEYSEKDGETFICRSCSSICSWAFQDPNCKKRCPFFIPPLVPEADVSTNSDIDGQNTSYADVEQTTGYADVEKMKDMVENVDCGTEGYSEKDGETFICRSCSSICSWAFQDPNCKKRCPFFIPPLVPEAGVSTNSDTVGQTTSYDGVEQTTGYADVEQTTGYADDRQNNSYADDGQNTSSVNDLLTIFGGIFGLIAFVIVIFIIFAIALWLKQKKSNTTPTKVNNRKKEEEKVDEAEMEGLMVKKEEEKVDEAEMEGLMVKKEEEKVDEAEMEGLMVKKEEEKVDEAEEEGLMVKKEEEKVDEAEEEGLMVKKEEEKVDEAEEEELMVKKEEEKVDEAESEDLIDEPRTNEVNESYKNREETGKEPDGYEDVRSGQCNIQIDNLS